MKTKLIVLSLFVLLAIPAWAQDSGAPAYRLSGAAGYINIDNQNNFTLGGGLERVWPNGAAVSTRINYFGSPLASSSATLSPGFAWYLTQGGRVEAFAFGKYNASVTETDGFSAGGGVNLFVFSSFKDLGLRLEIGDDVNFEGDQSPGLKVGVIFRF